MAQLFTIHDDKIVINKVALKYIEGSIIHAGSIDIVGSASVQNGLTVKGSITADTIHVKNLITEAGPADQLGRWNVGQESELRGLGFNWTSNTTSIDLQYREGGRIWTNGDIDLSANRSYRIDNIPVLSLTELSPQVTKSRLKEVGPLKSLQVTGDSNLGEVAFVNSNMGRFGINTDQPNGSLSISDNGGEFIIDSPNFGTFNVGSYTTHDISFVTDNTPRFTIKKSGEVIFGSPLTKTASVTINGTLTVDNLVSDTRIDRYSPLEFKSSRDQPIYGLGIHWNNGNGVKQLVLKTVENYDCVWSSESIDVSEGKSYYINRQKTLSANELGPFVTKSNLRQLGSLESLTVCGDSSFEGNMSATTGSFESLEISNVTFANQKINATNSLSINVFEDEVLYADSQEISIGNKLNSRRHVKIHGPVSIGINTEDPTVSLAVSGNVKFNNKKFISGLTVPTNGSFIVGDICWNENPTVDSYVGWICISEGSPGTWAPFGSIGRL
jgi:hypothetical protein